MSDMNLFRSKISCIQQELKAPKNLYNSFGKYKYRNAEGILEALKPFEDKYCVFCTVSDEIAQIGDRYYIKATATIFDCESDASVSTTALAREPEAKKGMDESQITGTASSYARKYALNGLLLLDDTKDPDTDEYHNQTVGRESGNAARKAVKIGSDQVKVVQAELKRTGISEKSMCAFYKVASIEDMTVDVYTDCMQSLQSKPTAKQ